MITLIPLFTTECKHLLSVGMLNVDAENRWDISHLRISHWMSGVVYPLTPYCCTKYQVEDCLPMTLPTPRRNPSINKPSSNVYSAQPPAFPVKMSQAEIVTASLSKATSSGTPKKNKASIDPLEKCLNTDRSNRSVKKKISKAGKKLVKTILRHSRTPQN